ncbi:MAG: CDP-diacylglycerol--serine O-phosphatidyltransferase [Verrucomicrobiota bacterium]
MSEQPQKMIYLLPNLMTAGNLFCGFMAVLQIFEGSIMRRTEVDGWMHHYQMSLYFIIGAFIFDLLDGRVARLGGTESPFGREFDSLADTVSFGVAPALLLFKIVLYDLPDRVGWLIAFFYLACGTLRLARFNTLAADPETKSIKDFTGVPIPVAAGLIASITLMLLHIYEDDRSIGNWKYGLAGLMIFLSFMMFSKIKYPSFKAVGWRTTLSVPTLLAMIILIGVIIFTYQYSLAICFTAYVVYGFVRPFLSKRWRPKIDEDDADEAAA